jgi:RIO-like serine/threonine protein kinase
METLWKNNFNSVTKAYDIQYVNFVIVVNRVSKEKKKGVLLSHDLRNIIEYFASRTRAADQDA